MEIGKALGEVERGAAVLGWRAWTVRETPSGIGLGSVLFDQLWLAREPAHASCRRDEDPFAPAIGAHDLVSPECSCGFYAARDPVDAFSYLRGRDEPSTLCRILGEVTLWGRVLETESGWRGELAYPTRLYVADASLSEALAVYGCLVVSIPPLEATPRTARV